MANSPVLAAAATLLRSWGVEVVIHARASLNGRPGTFAPIGVVRHHTASSTRSGETGTRDFIERGGMVPGPLSQLFIARDSTVHLISHGRANHAGVGGPWRTIPANSGNSYLVGVEVDNNGIGEPYPTKQLHTARLVDAALLIAMKRDASYLIGHKEWAAGRKVDPLLDMAKERAAVAALIREKTAPPPPPPAPTGHVVQRGDTLSEIADNYGTTVDHLAKLNGLTNPNLIAVGQVLRIPEPKTYTVRAGDTLTAIAYHHKTTVAVLVRINKLANPNAIQVGQKLRLPY